jgi:flagellar protein FliS
MQNPYFRSRVMTADRGQLLLMLYDGAIRFNEQACRLLRENDGVAALKPMSRTLAIIQELHSMLDNSKAPELCANLERLYLFMQDQLLIAQSTKNVEPLESISTILKDLRDSWSKAVEEYSKTGNVRRAG